MKNVSGKMVRKLYINQIVMSIFGFIVGTSATLLMEGYTLMVLASILATGVYLFIIYDAMWNAGAKDAAKRLRAEDAQLEKIKTPFFIVLFASAFNIIGAIAYAILWVIVYTRELTEGAVSLIGDAVHSIMNFTNAMYTSGFAVVLFPHPYAGLGLASGEFAEHVSIYGMPSIAELTAPWFYFLIPIPLFITGILAYYIGASENKLLNIIKQRLKILGFNS